MKFFDLLMLNCTLISTVSPVSLNQHSTDSLSESFLVILTTIPTMHWEVSKVTPTVNKHG